MSAGKCFRVIVLSQHILPMVMQLEQEKDLQIQSLMKEATVS
jgi:hypothetical protein